MPVVNKQTFICLKTGSHRLTATSAHLWLAWLLRLNDDYKNNNSDDKYFTHSDQCNAIIKTRFPLKFTFDKMIAFKLYRFYLHGIL